MNVMGKVRRVNKLTNMLASKRGALLVLVGWLVLMMVLTMVAPSAKKEATSISSSGLPEGAQSLVGEALSSRYFDEQEGVPALFVYHAERGLTETALAQVATFTADIGEKGWPEVAAVLPFEHMPDEIQAQFLSDDQSTLVLPLFLQEGLESSVLSEVLTKLEGHSKTFIDANDVTLYVTGPAGIATDATAIFANADLTLIFTSIALIFVLLIVIYRSPILAILPLVGAAIVYQVIDGLLGIVAKTGVEIETQALSIMSILLFAALTDYALFIVSRFREELQKQADTSRAMKKALNGVGSAIFFSGTTVIAALLILFVATYGVYRNFAPVFSVAMVMILLAGLTLLPALYVLVGKRAFWPFIPKVGPSPASASKIWGRISTFVTKAPMVKGIVVLVLFLVMAVNVTQIQFSFNLMKSFPEETPSRIGLEVMEEKFPAGAFTPTTVTVDAREGERLTEERLWALHRALALQPGVREVDAPIISEVEPNVATLEMRFENDPYDVQTLAQLGEVVEQEQVLLAEAGLADTRMYFSGETAEQVDIRQVNERDLFVILPLVTLVIMLLLGIQTKSLIAPLYMMFSILLSYGASLGASYFIFQHMLGYDMMSYRIPLYTFVFSVALGVDYAIMLVTRIQEEMRAHPLKKAVQIGLHTTGGVISSAGLILAATFAVLMTQPLLELYMFGFIVALGVLLDTFVVRTVLVPALMIQLGKWSFWPRKNAGERVDEKSV
ncbi:putative drug exporter of the RND superfamily [Shouchella lonarensis]|uniref:Putative drug exporter of the RND superfamily n=1 Tax=Shouchella lonarensis TaxID=1464122 RepID=A0A1G6IPI6_9BACI|nr:putative drug exporter of the RND superfamily [Shouchella lonarensis]